jgi:hypothetical protein
MPSYPQIPGRPLFFFLAAIYRAYRRDLQGARVSAGSSIVNTERGLIGMPQLRVRRLLVVHGAGGGSSGSRFRDWV